MDLGQAERLIELDAKRASEDCVSSRGAGLLDENSAVIFVDFRSWNQTDRTSKEAVVVATSY